MQDNAIHEGEPGFEEFIEEAMTLVGQHAQERGICIDCLNDRFIVEIVASLARSGVPAADILGMVADGLALAEDDQVAERTDRGHRMH